RVLPVHTYIVLTEPLSEAQLAEIGWAKRRASLETARNFIHYFRLTADNRIVFGGEDAELYWRGRYYNEDNRIFASLKARFREYFPTLRDLAFTHEWGGVLGVTLDMFPTFGVKGLYDSIYFACGYSGHGVALSNYAGAILAPQMLKDAGLPTPETDRLPWFYNRLPTWLPPDPMRFAGLKAYRLALRAQDTLQRS
ncbi:MAG: FAD-binding oxidoreductase, partial [Candidatus Hydrogenedentes bacterium]|nr:FAD-binding oxidoreductase [Candidatus Hydrogenedentota bacterium]